MKSKFQKLIPWLLVLTLALSGCIPFVNPLHWVDGQKLQKLVRESIEKTFPLPIQVIIRTHIGNNVRISTELSLDEVVAFYREAYGQKGYSEEVGSEVSVDSATMVFTHATEKDVWLHATKTEKGSNVHIRLQSPTP